MGCKIKWLLLCTCMIIFSASFAVMADETDYVTEYKNNMTTLRANNSQKLITALEKGLDDDFEKEKNVAKYSIKKAYTDIITEEKLISSYQKIKNFDGIKTDEMEWIVPIENNNGKKGYAILVPKGFDFELADIVLDEDSPRLDIDVEEVAAIVKGNANGKVLDCGVLYSKLYQTSLVYWNDVEGFYVVPYSDISSKCKTKNGDIYSLGEYINQLNKTFDESRYKEGSYKLAYRIHYIQIGAILIVVIVFAYLASSTIRRKIKVKIAKKRLAKKYEK